jgi:hypothetical protein
MKDLPIQYLSLGILIINLLQLIVMIKLNIKKDKK